jgi:predicted enzyme related to lactoylglutathione lyase
LLNKNFSAALVVKDAIKSAEWYRDKLGLEASTEEEHWVTVGVPGADWKIHLCQTDRYGIEPGNSGFALYCDDIEAEYKRLLGNGVKFSRELTKAPWGSFAMFLDPDGNEIWLQPGSP